MQPDVRRSDSTEPPRLTTETSSASSEPRSNPIARAFSALGKRKAKAASQEKLNSRLREVLERDRALVASEAPEELAEHVDDTMISSAPDFELEDEHWPDPFGLTDPDLQTGTRATLRDPDMLALAGEPSSAELALSQIASWIEEEIGELPETSSAPVSFEVPLDEHEAAELDAVLTGEPPALSEPEPAPEVSEARARAIPEPRLPEEDPVESGKPEPICTLTMARLLAMQGYKPRAIAVYRELLRRTPGDETLRTELSALEVE
jgi:hypothetical protein